jgi:hypothetical protein
MIAQADRGCGRWNNYITKGKDEQGGAEKKGEGLPSPDLTAEMISGSGAS